MLDNRTRSWAEIHLDNLKYNYSAIRRQLPQETGIMAVVKANGYGHGAVEISKRLSELGCGYFAVAAIEEALELRNSGIGTPILILGHTPAEQTDCLIDNELTQTVYMKAQAEEYSRIAQLRGKRLGVHLKIDSGMSRLGFSDQVSEILPVLELCGLEFEGIFTHFASADLVSRDFTDTQFNTFSALLREIRERTGIKFKISHCANSGAMVNCGEMVMDMVRIGLTLYGHCPGQLRGSLGLRDVMQLRTRIVQIKEIPCGATVSYGRTFTAPTAMQVAVLPLGYADGLPRSMSGKIEMLVHGTRVKQIGRICMDFCMIDVTGLSGVTEGDIVTVFGHDGSEYISIFEQAEHANTIPYELMCAISPRVNRLYL